jgi:hypothetical protein
MENGTQISLRSKRKPGYSWVDNEVSTCYQAIVGPDATWVYHNLAQQVQEQDREPSVSFALRDMAAWTGRSKDTVQRCLAVLELVGLIAVRRGAKAKARYDLLDVKELVLAHGGVYDVRRSSFVLPEASVITLKAAVKELRTRMARKRQPCTLCDWPSATAPVNRPAAVVEPAQSVAQSDRLPVDNLFLPGAECDSFVAQEDASVALEPIATSYRKEARSEEKSYTPLPPEKARGESAQNKKPRDAEKPENAPVSEWKECNAEAAIDQVMCSCGFVRRRLRRVLRDVLMQEHDRGTPFATTALAMIAAWKKYVLQGELLSAHYGPDKFFADGHWRDSRGWNWNAVEIERRNQLAGAHVGSY